MAADAIVDMVCNQGATFTATMTWIDTGAVLSTVGFAAKMQVRRFFGGAIALDISDGDGTITLGGTNGKITITLPPDVTADIPHGKYVYDLMLYNQTEAHRVIEGAFTVSPGVTRLG